jgi:regulator of nucleoside diphosphate kinase
LDEGGVPEITPLEKMMKPSTQRTVLTKFDHSRLRGLLQVMRERGNAEPRNLGALELKLRRAELVSPECVPSDVITMNSIIGLHDQQTGHHFSLRLVFPGSLAREGSVPVLSPLGIALLGRRVGELLQWAIPTGRQRLSIESVDYQPEAAGNFYL